MLRNEPTAQWESQRTTFPVKLHRGNGPADITEEEEDVCRVARFLENDSSEMEWISLFFFLCFFQRFPSQCPNHSNAL